jgi:energy-coupling factor transport system permease protein
MVFMTVTLLADTVAEFSAMIVFIALAVWMSKIPIKTVLRALKPILPLVVFASVINVFVVPGRPIFQLGFITATYEGLYLALLLSIRIFLIIVGGSSMMIFTTTPISLTDGVEKLMKPLKRIKVPVHEIAMMMTIALRFIPTLIEETDKIMKAQASRGADINEGKFFDRIKSFVPILIPLFVSAFRRAEELANAMEARCYRGDVGRTRLKQLRFTALDAYLLMFFAVFIAAFAAIKLIQ